MLRMIEGWDHYGDFLTSGQPLLGKWTVRNSTGPRGGNARFGTTLTGAIASQGNAIVNATSYYEKALGSLETNIHIFGIAYAGTRTAKSIISLYDGSTLQCYLGETATGTLAVYNGAGTILGQSAVVYPIANQWLYIQWKIRVTDSLGFSEGIVRVTDQYGLETDVINLAAASSTRSTSNNGFSTFRVGSTSGSSTSMDDFYWCDDTGSINNDFMGEQRIITYSANTNGTHSGWVGSDGNSVNNFDLINDAGQQVNTYVEASVVGTEDRYAFTDFPSAVPLHSVGNIKGIQVVILAWKTDADPTVKQVATTVNVSGSLYESTKTLTTSSLYYATLYEVDPSDSTAWTSTKYGNAQFGIKVIT